MGEDRRGSPVAGNQRLDQRAHLGGPSGQHQAGGQPGCDAGDELRLMAPAQERLGAGLQRSSDVTHQRRADDDRRDPADRGIAAVAAMQLPSPPDALRRGTTVDQPDEQPECLPERVGCAGRRVGRQRLTDPPGPSFQGQRQPVGDKQPVQAGAVLGASHQRVADGLLGHPVGFEPPRGALVQDRRQLGLVVGQRQ